MSDAAMKVDPEYYNKRLLETANVDQSRSSATGAGGSTSFRPAGPSPPPPSQSSWGGGGSGGGGGGDGVFRGGGGGGGGDPDHADYLVRQHSLLGFYLSLNPGDEADAERHWGFPHQQRAAIAGVTVVIPLFLALFVTGSWLWKACVIAVVTVGARLAVSFILATLPDAEVDVPLHGYTLAVWPHLTLGTLSLLALIWFVTAAATSTGWSSLWLCFTSLLFLVCAEAALRASMLHFQWWVPAARFSFLKPWGDSSFPSGGSGLGQVGRGGGYAPPRPSAAPPIAAAAPRPDYRRSDANGGGNVVRGAGGGGGGGNSGAGGGGVQLGDMDGGGGSASGSAAAPAAVAPQDESNGFLQKESGEDYDEGLEEIFASESV